MSATSLWEPNQAASGITHSCSLVPPIPSGFSTLWLGPATKPSSAQLPVAPKTSAKAPAGSVEQVAAKVMPSVVKLQIDMGGQGDTGSGIVLSADGLILTNNHVVAPAVSDDQTAQPTSADSTDGGGITKTVTFYNGQTAPFTVVGTDPAGDLAVVRAQGVSRLTPITIGSSKDARQATTGN